VGRTTSPISGHSPRRSIEATWNAEAKDRLERLCDLVCRGQLELATAQQAIALDWIETYRKYL
jgi:hypothetical protein